MTVNRTTLLDLPLPVTGTEPGSWGDTTNNGLTQYLDIAIAGTLVLSTDADVTLTSTEGDSSATNIGATTAQYAILRWTATGSTTRNITALAQSKTYVVINATGGTQSIVLRGAGPTTGVTIISGEKAHCVWNGSDFVKVSSSAAAGGSNTQVQYNSSGVLAGSSNMTFNGTKLTVAGFLDSALTSGRVPYATTSGELTDSANLLYSGTDLTVYGITVGRGAGAVSTNTAVGASALASNNTANQHTAVGYQALQANTSASRNTAVGYLAGTANTSGHVTAIGAYVLYSNTSGNGNTGVGGNDEGTAAALQSNTTGSYNTAVGTSALGSNTTASNNTAVGYQAFYSNTISGNNIGIGYLAGYSNTTGGQNIAIGNQALYSNTTTSNNTAVGHQALLNTTTRANVAFGANAGQANTTGVAITAIGMQALTANTTGNYNTAVGTTDNVSIAAALYANTTGTYNVAVGTGSLSGNTTANANTGVGYQSLYNNSTGTSNTAVGYQALQANTATGITAVGSQALLNNTSGIGNNAFGVAALRSNTTGTGNNAFGGDISGVSGGALQSNTTGSYNTAMGGSALVSNTTASYNTAVGYQAGYSGTTAASNTSLGAYALYSTTTGGQNVAVGQTALNSNTTGANSVAIGFSALYTQNGAGTYNVGIGAYAGYYLTTGTYNTFVGTNNGTAVGQSVTTGSYNTFIGGGAGGSMTTGSKNTILGSYNGNQGGLDIRTSSNYIVLSDGDGNPQFVHRKDFGVAINDRPQISSSYVDSQNKSVINLYEGTNGNFEIASGYSTSDFVVGTGGTSGNIAYSANGGSYLSIASGLMAIVGTTFTIGSNTYTVTSESSEGLVYCTPSAAGEAATGTLVGLKYATEGFRVYDNRTAQFKSTVGVGGTAGSTSGAGITFPATQSASSNANTLDDYEEGTWTPTTVLNGFTQSISTLTGSYTKTGNVVVVCMKVALSASGYPSSYSEFSGLPFTVKAGFDGAGCFNGSNVGSGNQLGNALAGNNSTNVFWSSITVGTTPSTNWYATITYLV